MGRRTARVAALTVAALLVIGALAALTIESSYQAGLTSERSKLAATAQVTAELVSRQMVAVEDITKAAVQRVELLAPVGAGAAIGWSAAALQPVLDQVQSLRPEFQFVALSDAQGTTRASSPADARVIGRNFSFRDWYQGVTRTGTTYVSRAYVSAITGAPLVVAVATPIREAGPGDQNGARTGPIIGILFIGYKIGSVQAFADRLGSVQQIALQLTDQAGVVMARPGGIQGRLVTAAGAEVTAALAGRSSSAVTDAEVAAGVPVPSLGWTVRVSTPLGSTAAAGQRTTATLIALGLMAVLVGTGGALVLMTRRLERTDARHAAAAAQLRTVQSALTDAIQVFAPDGALTYRNPAADELYEAQPTDLTAAAVAARFDMLHADGTALAVEDGPLATAMRTGETSEGVIVGLRRKSDGTVRWLSISTVPIRPTGTAVSGYVSAARDITERMQTIRELEVLGRASQQLSASLVPTEVLRALTAAAGELCSAPGESQRRAQVFVIDGSSMVLAGEHDPDHTLSADGTRLLIAEHPYIERVIERRTPLVAGFTPDEFGPGVAALIRRSEIKNSAWLPMMVGERVVAVLAVNGRQHELISSDQLQRLATLATIGQLAMSNAEAHERVAELARTDALTGVGNRRALDDRLAQLPRRPFALVAIDVDDLKKVNDAHGHDAGDDLLERVATTMAAQLRPSDLLARTGGDEFVALLLDCDASGAKELSERLRRAAAALDFPWGPAGISVGSAAGLAGDDPEAVAKAADQALYAAKVAGKLTPVGVAGAR